MEEKNAEARETKKRVVILIADDDVLSLRSGAFILKGSYKVLTASSLEEACRLIKFRKRISLILVNGSNPEWMPIRSSRKAKTVATYSPNTWGNGGYPANGTAVIQKPFSPWDLPMMVKEILNSPGNGKTSAA